ncbi:hypothetical protein Droror1_Dr00027416 [Drosera rotundifolia]
MKLDPQTSSFPTTQKAKAKQKQDVSEIMSLMIKHRKRRGRGPSTPPPPTWPPVESSHTRFHTSASSSVTARQLGAAVWEMSSYQRSRGRRRGGEERGKMEAVVEDLDDGSGEEQPQSTSSFHRQIAESLMQHRRSRSFAPLRPVSPESCSSSMEVTPFNPADTPSSSLAIQAKTVETSYGPRTSTKLLRVLNRIWSIEEKHKLNASLVKSLKTELENARVRIKELLKEKRTDNQVIANLMKQITEDKLVIKSMEQERTKSKVHSARNEAEEERKLRKRSETLHRKLAREVSELKSSFSTALNELQRERQARIIVENLCDEFALCIRDYEREPRSLNHGSEKDLVFRENDDGLVIHMSEAWLDERAQLKVSNEKKKTIVDELGSEIETFLRSRRREDLRGKKVKERNTIWRHSLESFPLIEAGSAPKLADDEDDSRSTDSFSNCFELNNKIADGDGIEQARVEENGKDKVKTTQGSSKSRGMSSLQARFLRHVSSSHDNARALRRPGTENQSKRFPIRGADSNHTVDSTLNRSSSSSMGGHKVHPEADRADASKRHITIARSTSPVKKWEPSISTHSTEEVAKSGSKEHTLKARLLEARLEGKQSKSRAS